MIIDKRLQDDEIEYLIQDDLNKRRWSIKADLIQIIDYNRRQMQSKHPMFEEPFRLISIQKIFLVDNTQYVQIELENAGLRDYPFNYVKFKTPFQLLEFMNKTYTDYVKF